MLRPVGDTVGHELDGAVATPTLDRPRHLKPSPTPEGLAFTTAAAADVRSAVVGRDAPFGDYGQARR